LRHHRIDPTFVYASDIHLHSPFFINGESLAPEKKHLIRIRRVKLPFFCPLIKSRSLTICTKEETFMEQTMQQYELSQQHIRSAHGNGK
jgi:hypothetical protein